MSFHRFDESLLAKHQFFWAVLFKVIQINYFHRKPHWCSSGQRDHPLCCTWQQVGDFKREPLKEAYFKEWGSEEEHGRCPYSFFHYGSMSYDSTFIEEHVTSIVTWNDKPVFYEYCPDNYMLLGCESIGSLMTCTCFTHSILFKTFKNRYLFFHKFYLQKHNLTLMLEIILFP